MQLNTFKQVEDRYNNTKPVSGVRTKKEYDVRPIGPRRATHNRICKINNNCYALMTWTQFTDAPRYEGSRPVPKDIIAMSAPIVWRRDSKGFETVTIHNDRHGHATGWYMFLNDWLPRGITFDNRGRHKINIMGGLSFYLPRNKIDAAPHKDDGHHVKKWRDKYQWGSSPRFERGLTFQRFDKDGHTFRWKQVGESYDEHLRTKSAFYIDKEAKAEFKADIVKFREWSGAMLPLMSVPSGWKEKHDLVKSFVEPLNEALPKGVEKINDVRFFGHWWEADALSEAFRQALKSEDSPARIPMLYAFLFYMESNLYSSGLLRNVDRATLMGRMNDFINRSCGFRKRNV